MEKQQILVISEDPIFYSAVQSRMQNAITDVLLILPASKAVSSYVKCEYRLVIWDWQHIGVDNIKMLHMMRKAKCTPILVLVDGTDTAGIVSIYQAGATACLEKNVDIDICVAQAHALIRLCLEYVADYSLPYPMAVGSELVINPLYRQVLLDGEQVKLTRREFNLLYYLARHPGQVLTLGQLYDHIWGDDHGMGGDETVRAHIKTLRKKLGEKGKVYIQNIWGVGYKFSPPSNV